MTSHPSHPLDPPLTWCLSVIGQSSVETTEHIALVFDRQVFLDVSYIIRKIRLSLKQGYFFSDLDLKSGHVTSTVASLDALVSREQVPCELSRRLKQSVLLVDLG